MTDTDDMASVTNTVPRFDLSRLLSPRSIAVIGGQSAATVVEQCRRIGYAGDLYAVNPDRQEVGGVTCVRSLDDLPVGPDACFLGVSPQLTVEMVSELASRDAGGVVCYASGFAEAGERGQELQRTLVERAGKMPLVGPNCHGFINYLDGVALWPDHFGGERTECGPALLMQSGNIGINVTFQQRGLAFSYVVAMGNNAQLDVHDYMHALLDDPRVTAIGLHLEGIKNVPQFTIAALRALRQRVPVVAIKTGSSELGASMALSHTRSLTNPDDLVDAMFHRYGVARCRSVPELLETLKFVSVGGAIVPDAAAQGGQPRIASMSCSGGEASHLADLAVAGRLTFPSLSDATTHALSTLLGERVHVSNPLDYHTYVWGNETVLTEAFTLLLREPLDCALLILDYPPPGQFDVSSWLVAERALCAASAATDTRVAVVSSLPENLPASARERLREQGVAPMQGLAECVQAIRHAGEIGRAQRCAQTLTPVQPARIRHEDGRTLDEWTSKQALAKSGLAVPVATRCHPAAAVTEATRIGFPVVMKALGAHLTHKTELGAVRVGVGSVAEVERHAHELQALGDELLIEAMVEDAVAELLVGVTHDRDFGQVLVLGAGGVYVELISDTAELLLPTSRSEVEGALKALRIGRLLRGFRGSDAGNVEAALDAIMAICAYADAHRDTLLELDVNPLLVRPVRPRDGQSGIAAAGPEGAMAVDALIRLAAAD